MKKLFILFLFISLPLWSKEDPSVLYKKVFKDYSSLLEHAVIDTISENPINNKILEFKNEKSETLGFAREIVTTTGCDSACLPVVATLFYTKERKFLTLKSRDGLTKKYHAAFTEEDYQNLEMILLQNPPIFAQVKHPKEMVDAITSETTKDFSPYVIYQAAYSSLRLNLYNQDTLKLLQGIK
jgi:hypothetical protein